MPLFVKALGYNLDSHRANPVNLAAGVFGMILNNAIFLAGIWAMLFAGKGKNQELIPYFLTLQAMVMIAWGGVMFFAGGLKSLPEYITDGTLEPMLATPRSPIFLAAISRSSATALGDLIMGLVGLVLIGWKWGAWMAWGGLAAAVTSGFGFIALFILAGAISFFIPRGSQVGDLLVDITLSMSCYPTGKIFSGTGRLVLLLTPAAVTAILPMAMVEKLGWRELGLALLAAGAFFFFSIGLFRLGIKRYRAVSLIGARR